MSTFVVILSDDFEFLLEGVSSGANRARLLIRLLGGDAAALVTSFGRMGFELCALRRPTVSVSLVPVASVESVYRRPKVGSSSSDAKVMLFCTGEKGGLPLRNPTGDKLGSTNGLIVDRKSDMLLKECEKLCISLGLLPVPLTFLTLNESAAAGDVDIRKFFPRLSYNV